MPRLSQKLKRLQRHDLEEIAFATFDSPIIHNLFIPQILHKRLLFSIFSGRWHDPGALVNNNLCQIWRANGQRGVRKIRLVLLH